jgi:capsular exopolysaccharide synthesis family protein
MRKTEKDSLVAGVPLGSIIPRKFKDSPELVVVRQPNAATTERFRRLAAKLDRANNGGPARTIVVTSATASEGKTLTSLNLALSLSEERERTTLLVDGDMRRPRITGMLTPKPKLGLSEVLAGEVPLEHALIRVQDSRVTVLPAGTPVSNPLQYLQHESARAVLGDLLRLFDRVVIDTPPSVPFSDASVFGSAADGTLLVVRAGRTKKPMIDRALESLEGNRLLGVLLNDVRLTAMDRYYYYYDDYDIYRYTPDDEREVEANGAVANGKSSDEKKGKDA